MYNRLLLIIMSLLFAHRWDCFSGRPGFVGNETCSAATTNGSMKVTVAVTPGSCDNNMCGLQHQAGSCSSGRRNCPEGSQMTPGFARNPNETALALVPLVPVCRYPFFTPSGALSWSGMTVKSGTTLDITFTSPLSSQAQLRSVLHLTLLCCPTLPCSDRHAASAQVQHLLQHSSRWGWKLRNARMASILRSLRCQMEPEDLACSWSSSLRMAA